MHHELYVSILIMLDSALEECALWVSLSPIGSFNPNYAG